MKRVAFILISIIFIGGAFVSFWIYDRYFRQNTSEPFSYLVSSADLKEQLLVRGEISAEREYDLAFQSFGNVAEVAVTEGQAVSKGDFLMRLDTSTATLELKRLLAERLQAQGALSGTQAQQAAAEAAYDVAQARLAELQRGTTSEAITVQKSQVDLASQAVNGAGNTLLDVARSAYTQADDAVRNIADQMFDDPRTNPSLKFLLPDSSLVNSLEIQRLSIEEILSAWQASLAVATTGDEAIATQAQTNLTTVIEFLDDLSLGLSSAVDTAQYSAATIEAWQVDVASARTSVDTAVVQVTDATSSLDEAQATLVVEEDQLSVLEAGTSIEEITGQQASVSQASASVAAAAASVSQAVAAISIVDAKIDLVNKTIRDASLYAPANAVVTKIWFKDGEQYQQSLEGQPVISLATQGIKIQSEITELDIPKIHAGNGNDVRIVFDAFPEREYSGEVVVIEPKEIIRDADTYYLVDITIDDPEANLRRGMSADLTIYLSEKADVLAVPLFLVSERGDQKFVNIQSGDDIIEVEVQTGISDGEFVEIISGLSAGQTVVASTP